MNQTERIDILFRLGQILDHLGHGKSWPGFELGINEDEYNQLNELIERVHVYNGWFTPAAVKSSFLGLADWLTKEKLEEFSSQYSLNEGKPRTVAVIMAGNIPLVGFHDFLAIFLSGHKTLAKLSSDDRHLFPALLKTMKLFREDIDEWLTFTDGPIRDFDAVIATGSNNSAMHFESYFKNHPNIIRKNRNAVAVLEGDETEEELKALGADIFTYFGLGCRNVSHLWIPENFELDRFFGAIVGFGDLINHNKYANNYDYNRAVYLLNQEDLLDNGFLLLKEEKSLSSPLGVLFYTRYKERSEVEEFLKENEGEIQVVVGKSYTPFGQAQCPTLEDFADGVDTMKFLEKLK